MDQEFDETVFGQVKSETEKKIWVFESSEKSAE
jgi:hypothetical protein